MKDIYDIAIIGAGPAGMAAAILCAQQGASVVLVDEQAHAGGQIYRGLAHQAIKNKKILGADYYKGSDLLAKLQASNITQMTGATVWQVSPEHEIGISKDGSARLFKADQIIIATGAQERPFPVPGWTLPGVMNAGAAQILLKSSGVTIPNAVFIGTGPLLYLIACQYLQAGIPIRAILDTTPRGNYLNALPHLPRALTDIGALIKGRSWIKHLRSSGIPYIKYVENIRLVGEETLRGIEYCQKGSWHQLETNKALLHQGIVPNTNMAMAAGCKHSWNDAQLCWHADIDDWAQTSISGIAVAGDGVSISGALVAEISGGIAALGALYRGQHINAKTRDQLAAPLRRLLARELRIRPFLDALFRPLPQFRIPDDDATIVCRCEEVTAGEIRKAVDEGCLGPNQLKGFTRCGMGPCQGRFCGLTVNEIIARCRDVPVAQVGAFRLRPPVKPLMLGELANLAETSDWPPESE